MTPEQFAYWLQGFTELNPDMDQPTPAQWKAIKDHLATVFNKVTPTGERRWRRPADPNSDPASPGFLLLQAHLNGQPPTVTC
ncbi:hypothetical protein [Pseudomonas sp. AN3A02]|uniref:hypothetical protein n=1 Tax=unclassified Pseudomonas TaxID=196821 RepID=UPI0014300E2B|nr:hypothetical protein [Pseudomonas sp. AN3A02]NIL20080.1 hypothetical protein [Pseudomonas sp. AN3A02]